MDEARLEPPRVPNARCRAACRAAKGIDLQFEEAENGCKKIASKARSVMVKKVQVVYYLTRNGVLEHPHFLEVSHCADNPLCLHHVLEKLAVLRGRAMPSRYSWSCKRSYKNGYVWNDLSENDVIWSSTQAAECVLKGSELLITGPGLAQERAVLPQLQSSYENPKHDRMSVRHQMKLNQTSHDQSDEEPEEEDENESKECNESEKTTSCTGSITTPSSGCSQGASITDELNSGQNSHSPPGTISSDDNLTHSVSLQVPKDHQQGKPYSSKKFEHGDSSPIVPFNRNKNSSTTSSFLLQLIACGGGSVVSTKSRKPISMPCLKQQLSHPHRGLSYTKYSSEDDDHMIIKYMSENPRFGNLQSEEKEFFSGSIVEVMNSKKSDDNGEAVVSEPVLKKSSSYNEGRSSKARLGSETATAEEAGNTKAESTATARGQKGKKEKLAVKVKCIPRKKHHTHNSSSRQDIAKQQK
ncbi:hypothetical protein Droror1_Dr00028008 [Drosera rotundifolia]